MDSRGQPLPQALVLRWNDYTLRVKCPYCPYSHGHAFAPTPPELDVDQTRQGWQFLVPSYLRIRWSDCNYEDGDSHSVFVFPLGDEATEFHCGWELDREEQSLVTVNSQGVVPVPVNDCRDGRTILAQHEAQHQLSPSVDDLAEATEHLRLDPEEAEEEEEPPAPSPTKTGEEILQELYKDPDYRRRMYVSHCCFGELRSLVSLCRQYPDDQLIGSLDDEGDTGSLLAATQEKGLDVLKWLHAQGDSLTLANHYGRTPLMEAALWGRLKTVRYLIREGVDIEACDANGMRAIDLSSDTERNTKERTTRCGGVYRESSDAGQHRKQIKALLERTALPGSKISSQAGSVSTAVGNRRTLFDRNSDRSLEILRPQDSVQPPEGQSQKAFATLDRGAYYPDIIAMSGYTQRGKHNVLDNEEWATKADTLRALFGLPKNRALASHVEPQLLAYLLDRHSLYKWDSSPGSPDRELSKLSSVLPPHSIRPIITISKSKICHSCNTFIEHFRTRFPGLNVKLECVSDRLPPPLHVTMI